MKNKLNIVLKFIKTNGKCLLVFFLLISYSSHKAQLNYVSNGGFENLDTCKISPYTTSEIWFCNSWDTLSNGGGLGYVMNNCFNPNTYWGIPNNLQGGGYQIPRTGDGYAYIVYFKLTPNPAVNWRWYIQQKMKDTLVAGKEYCVTYWASLINYVNYAVDELGSYFDDGSIQSISWSHEAPANPQVKSPSGVFYMDTLNWMKVQGTFTANGTESYITLGNFRLNAATTYTSLDGQSAGIASYFIDDVSVIETDLPAYAGQDKWLVPGDSVYIGRPSEVGLDDDCFWYKLPNTTTAIGTVAGLYVKPVATTTYVVKQDICGYVNWDTVVVYQSALGLNNPNAIENDITISPNPAGDYFELKIENEKNVKAIYLYNTLGQIIKNYIPEFKNKNIVVSISDLPTGVYNVCIHLKGNQIFYKRLVITR